MSGGINHCEHLHFHLKTHSLSVSLENCIQILQTWLLYLLINYIFSFLPYSGSLITEFLSYGPVRDYDRDRTISYGLYRTISYGPYITIAYGPYNMNPIIGYLILSLKSNSQFRTCSQLFSENKNDTQLATCRNIKL